MQHRTKPTEWKLESKPQDELLKIALRKLRQRTIREGEKMDQAFADGERDEKQRSKFYAIWYAFEALRIYAIDYGIGIREPFNYEKPKMLVSFHYSDSCASLNLRQGDKLIGRIQYFGNDFMMIATNNLGSLNNELKSFGEDSLVKLFGYLKEARE